MPRPLRFVPPNAIVEVTTRTMQGRLLLRPSPELTDIILGIIGKAQDMYGMAIHAFVVLSTHAHFLLSPTGADQLALFMQFVNANIAKEAGRLHQWRERFWSRRYRSIVVADEKAACARLRYIMAHGAKEGLVVKSGDWPGPQCIAALTTGESLCGTWFDRSAEFVARQRGDNVLPNQFATSYDIKLTPLSCHSHLSPDRRQAEYRRMVAEIQAAAEAENVARNRKPMGAALPDSSGTTIPGVSCPVRGHLRGLGALTPGPRSIRGTAASRSTPPRAATSSIHPRSPAPDQIAQQRFWEIVSNLSSPWNPSTIIPFQIPLAPLFRTTIPTIPVGEILPDPGGFLLRLCCAPVPLYRIPPMSR